MYLVVSNTEPHRVNFAFFIQQMIAFTPPTPPFKACWSSPRVPEKPWWGWSLWKVVCGVIDGSGTKQKPAHSNWGRLNPQKCGRSAGKLQDCAGPWGGGDTQHIHHPCDRSVKARERSLETWDRKGSAEKSSLQELWLQKRDTANLQAPAEGGWRGPQPLFPLFSSRWHWLNPTNIRGTWEPFEVTFRGTEQDGVAGRADRKGPMKDTQYKWKDRIIVLNNLWCRLSLYISNSQGDIFAWFPLQED